MDASRVLQAIVERLNGQDVAAVSSIPLGLIKSGTYTGQDEEVKSKLAQVTPRFSAVVRSDEPLNWTDTGKRLHKLTVDVTTTYHFGDVKSQLDHAKRAVLARAPTVAALVADALVLRGGLEFTSTGEATLISSGACAKQTRSQLTKNAPQATAGSMLEWEQTFELYVESMTPAGVLMSTEGFTDNDYWQGTTHFGGNPLGTKGLVLRLTGTDDPGVILSHRRAWGFQAYNGALTFFVTSFTTIYVDQVDFRWPYPADMDDSIVVCHGVCNGTTQSLYVGGVLVSNTVTLDAVPTAQPAQLLTIGRHEVSAGISSSAFGIVHLEATDSVMSASEIARDAALCRSTMTQRARFPALPASILAFDARDANGSTWTCQRNPLQIFNKTGSPRWRSV